MAAGSMAELVSMTITASQQTPSADWNNPRLVLEIPDSSLEESLQFVENISRRTYVEDVHFVLKAIVGPIICLFGLMGNTLSILTWRRPGMSSSTGRYLTGQAIANICFLLMFLLCDSLQLWCPSVKQAVVYGAFFSYFGFPMFYFSVICSIWFTVGLTVDRYIMVCWITKAKKFCNESRATFGMVVTALCSFIINIPHFASFTPIYQGHGEGDNNSTEVTAPGAAFAPTTFTTGPGGQAYEFWVHCIFIILGPWVTIFFMNIMIITKLSQANKRMADKKTSHSLKKSKESENQITRLLLTVTFTFLIFMGLTCVVQCLITNTPPGADVLALSASLSFSVTGVLLNSSLNFLLYCMSGRRFRMELLKMFGLVSVDSQSSSNTDTTSSNISTKPVSTISTQFTSKDV
ncbi:unnamed protein product [Candidula unifasciata]|uniref:G-protein coupled receptors family 1 profile domain-containing protein n=1 Tax=Candidula unifasciata TaxID=100452 RepID=A0A8S3YRE5_9EUPU|nr:unnamed protein product [Candidula unifasciata]